SVNLSYSPVQFRCATGEGLSVFAPNDMLVAQAVFEAIVGEQPRRALALEPVVRWPRSAWLAITDCMRAAGFDNRNPGHLAALQSLIDRACDA
ncbi:MAG TPA: hypothetical protein VMU46_17825, partial [Burkholderiales bacterium]|nr:hypothetical protein [Burkholderiales bacterium]